MAAAYDDLVKPGDGLPAACGAELLSWWRYYNDLYLGSRLREPVLQFSRSETRLGSYEQETRTLSISEAHVRRHTWLAVMETLRHEMAHQYAFEVLRATDEPAHGPAFRRSCELLRVSASARGTGEEVTDGKVADDRQHSAIVIRISKLLSLSTSPNENEAQAAINKARELLLKHNIDALDLNPERQFGARWLGAVKGRHPHHEQLLAAILGEFFFVSPIWVHSYDAERQLHGTVLAVYGAGANLEMAEYVHDYLSGVLDVLWADYKQRNKLRGNRERLRYFAGVLHGFQAKLRSQDETLRTEHALVWTGDPALQEFVRHCHPSIRTGYSGGGARGKAYEDGLEEGRSVSLRRPIRGSKGGFGGFLTG